MEKFNKQEVVKMNISLERDFYEFLQEKAKQDYVRVATWVRQYLMKNLLDKNNTMSNALNHGKCK